MSQRFYFKEKFFSQNNKLQTCSADESAGKAGIIVLLGLILILFAQASLAIEEVVRPTVKEYIQITERYSGKQKPSKPIAPIEISAAQVESLWADGNQLYPTDSRHNLQLANGEQVERYTPLLVGVRVNRQEVAAMDVLQSRKQLLVPLEELLALIDSSFLVKEHQLFFFTPAGERQMSIEQCFKYQGKVWLSMALLNQHLLLNMSFDQADYALDIFPPWRSKSGTLQTGKTADLPVDIRPNDFSLKQFRLTHEYQEEGDSSRQYTELAASGAAYEGVWRFELEQQNQQDANPKEYFWLSRDEHAQWLLGKQVITPSVLTPAANLTGGQYFYSNKPLEYNPYEDLSQGGFFKKLGNNLETIRGKAQAGNIAQLYINGRFSGEVFVNLDGYYDFGQIQLTSSLFNEIEVVILDRVSRSIIEKINKNSANSESLLEQGQHISSIALGKRGNLLSPNYQDEGNAAMLLYRYGLSNRTSIETGYLLNDQSHLSAGIISALGERFVGAARVATRDDALATQLELDGYGEKWRLSSYFRQTDAEYFSPQGLQRDMAHFNYNYKINPKLRVELVGHYDTQEDLASYFKPGFFYQYDDKLSMSSRPSFDGSYRSELYYRHNKNLRARLSHKPTEQSGRVDWRLSPAWDSYYSMQQRESDNQLREIKQAIGGYWRAGDWSDYNYVRLELSHSDIYGEGAFAEYRSQLSQGIYLDLQLSHNQSNFSSSQTDDIFDEPANPMIENSGGLSVFARVSFDFALSSHGLVSARNVSAYNTDGSISGKIISPDGKCQLEKASILIDGLSNAVVLDDCHFVVHRVRPGVHRISLDSEHLPIEYVATHDSYRVLVAPSAVSELDLAVSQEYGVAGKLFFADKTAAENAASFVWLNLLNSDGEIINQVQSDQFGYYRVDGLKTGQYRLEPSNQKGDYQGVLQFEIKNDFLFGLDLELKASEDTNEPADEANDSA